MPTPEQKREYQRRYRERAKTPKEQAEEFSRNVRTNYVEDPVSAAIRGMSQWQRDQILARITITGRKPSV